MSINRKGETVETNAGTRRVERLKDKSNYVLHSTGVNNCWRCRIVFSPEKQREDAKSNSLHSLPSSQSIMQNRSNPCFQLAASLFAFGPTQEVRAKTKTALTQSVWNRVGKIHLKQTSDVNLTFSLWIPCASNANWM